MSTVILGSIEPTPKRNSTKNISWKERLRQRKIIKLKEFRQTTTTEKLADKETDTTRTSHERDR